MKRSKFIRSLLMMSVGFIFASVVGAQAVPFASSPYTNGRDLFAAGTSWTAVFLYADAGDTSRLFELKTPTGVIFQNNNTGTYPIGDTKYFSSTAGQSLVFSLVDLSVTNTWNTGSTSTNVTYYNYGTLTDLETGFGVNLSPAAESALSALTGDVVILGFEDRLLGNSDRDFNDLIFAVSSVRTQVPEPTTLLLFGLGLLGLAGLRRKFQK